MFVTLVDDVAMHRECSFGVAYPKQVFLIPTIILS